MSSSDNLDTTKFKKQVLKTLCINKVFSSNYISVLSSEYFDKYLRIIFNIIKDYIVMYESELDVENLCILIQDYCIRKGHDEQLLKSLCIEAKSIFTTHVPSEEFVIDKTVNFIRTLSIKQAMLKSIDILEEEGNVEDILSIISGALSVGDTRDEGLSFDDLFNIQMLHKEYYDKESLITTGLPILDSSFMGGMAPGEIHIVMSQPKSGKSTYGVNVGVSNLVRGNTVFHITCELSEIDVLTKYACRLSGLSYIDLLQETNINRYKEKIENYTKYKPNLFVKHYAKGTASCSMFRSFITKMISKYKISGRILIIVDYDDCVIPVSGKTGSMYEDAGLVYTDLIQLGGYIGAPVFSFAQPNRPAWNKYHETGEFVLSDDLAHSAMKAHAAHSISSLNFKTKKDSHGWFYLDLNRRGRSEVQIPIYRDFSRAVFAEDNMEYSDD